MFRAYRIRQQADVRSLSQQHKEEMSAVTKEDDDATSKWKPEEEEEDSKMVVSMANGMISKNEEEDDDMVTDESSGTSGGSMMLLQEDESASSGDDEAVDGPSILDNNNSSTLGQKASLFDLPEEEEEQNELVQLVQRQPDAAEQQQVDVTRVLCADITREDGIATILEGGGSLSDRFRNAWTRVRQNPYTDTEAWKALVSEAQMGFKEQWSSSATSKDFSKWDLMESIYGALLQHFPYSPYPLLGLMEFLYTLSSFPHELGSSSSSTFFSIQRHPTTNTNTTSDMELSRRRTVADLKLTHVIQTFLGIPSGEVGGKDESDSDANTPPPSASARDLVRSNMVTSYASLWMIYLQKVSRDTQRKFHSIYTPEAARSAMIQAYEHALTPHPFVLVGGHILWKHYISYLTGSMTYLSTDLDTEEGVGTATADMATLQPLRMQLRNVYQRCFGIPMQDLDTLWMEYTNFEKQISEVLSQPLLAEHLPRYQHSKHVFLERSNLLQYTPELLYSPPHSNNVLLSDQNKRFLSIPPENTEKERLSIQCYLRRIAYERTNPERLSPTELLVRVRQAYKDTIGLFLRHVEVWHEWSSFEYHYNSSSSSLSFSSCDIACEVLSMAMEQRLDSALLAATHAEYLESNGRCTAAITVLENFITDSPCTLGYILLQRLIRRTQGIQPARLVFKRARQNLLDPSTSEDGTGTVNTTIDPSTTTNTTKPLSTSFGGDATHVTSWTMNRMKASKSHSAPTGETQGATSTNTIDSHLMEPKAVGYITWHLYASHAHIELRCNRCPQVAARVFELGITRHRSFLTCPSYIREYAHLLIEQGDHDNLRSLLERAIAACQQELGIVSNKNISLAKYNQRQRLLWDMLLEFESNVSLADPNVIRNLEARRRRALPSEQQQFDDNDLLPKNIQEQLSRVGGEFDGLIYGGLGRMVRRYELIGILGYGGGGEQEELAEASLNDTSSSSVAVNYGGRKSDASFSYRYHGLSLSHPSEMTGSTTAGSGIMDRSRAARERAQVAGGQLPQGPAAAGAISKSLDLYSFPEWMRTLVAMLPVQRMPRIHSKPPPHMIEMALAALRNRSLPATRPVVDSTDGSSKTATASAAENGSKRKRRLAGDDDSSDEEVNTRGGGGYSSQFRMRQRARQDNYPF